MIVADCVADCRHEALCEGDGALFQCASMWWWVEALIKTII